MHMPGSWVARLADEERQKDHTRSRVAAAAVHHADLVRFRLQCLMVSLKSRALRDVEAFTRELPGRRVSFAASTLDDGFSVRRDSYPEAHLTVTPNLHDETIRVQYLFASADGVSAPRLLELVLDRDDGSAVHVKDSPTQRFESAEQLAEYLLVPLFSGHSH
jgi:hypothetical protein